MIEHREWCPEGYFMSGLKGQKVAVVGYSHWSNECDSETLTKDVVGSVVSGDFRSSFFTSISRYFEFEDLDKFWSMVMFFNFLPCVVGKGVERYGSGTSMQLDVARARVLKIMQDHKPDKLFVFSMKAWRDFPPTVEDEAGEESQPPFYWHTYVTPDGHKVKAVGLRHPQGANKKEMTIKVRQLMADI